MATPLTSRMHELLRNQLTVAEETFLAAISEGPTAIEAFMHSWSALEKIVNGPIDLDEETVAHAHNVASRIEIIAGFLMQLHQETSAVTLSLQTDIDAIFADLNIEDPLLQTVHKPSRSKIRGSAMPPYIEPAYTWLLDNLHDPYPSKEIKTTFARQTNSSLNDIDNWFINVRKRIGWNKLRMKHYNNKRSKIVDAATRFFTLRRGHTPISGTDLANHDSDFEAIDSCARELYSDKSLETSSGTLTTKVHAAKDQRRLSVYPTPDRSPEPSPSPSATPLPISNATPAISRKRRNCDRDSPEFDVEYPREEPHKRSRLDSYHISPDLAVASLPSPAASLSDITRDSSVKPSNQGPSENDCFILSTPIPAAPSGKRKRRLSDAGYDGSSKRPHNALAIPRLQTVSDPLPLTVPISEFYESLFGQTISDTIPGPVNIESLDDTQVEVNFYNYDTPPDIMQSFLLADSSLDPYPAAPSLSTADSEPLSLDKSQVSDPSLDFLFENYLKDVSPPATDMPFFADIPFHDHSTLFPPFENMFPTQPLQGDILSDPSFQIPGLWDFQGNDDNYSTMVPSIGTLFSSDSFPPQIDSTQNEKEAKRKQIEALRAQIQSLEAEP